RPSAPPECDQPLAQLVPRLLRARPRVEPRFEEPRPAVRRAEDQVRDPHRADRPPDEEVPQPDPGDEQQHEDGGAEDHRRAEVALEEIQRRHPDNARSVQDKYLSHYLTPIPLSWP